MRDSENTPYPFLDASDPREVASFLQDRGWLRAGEAVLAVSRAGEGNMNLVLRVRTDRRSIIVKQARPWVEKYPQIAAPPERALVEAAFYRAASGLAEVGAGMPALLGADDRTRSLLFEDLGDVQDFTSIYAEGALTTEEAALLGRWLADLHARIEPEAMGDLAQNRAMRALNHAHMFEIPFGESVDLDAVDPGLQATARAVRLDSRVRERAAELGGAYLADGSYLLHGDYYPGSWVRSDRGVRIIDPEFCLPGPKEFDLGVMTAHLTIAGVPDAVRSAAREAYAGQARIDEGMLRAFAGNEILRRLLGVAQLPMQRTLEQRLALIEKGRDWLLA